MADTKPSDFSTTAASNATVGGVNIAEGSSAAQLNDALRAVLAVIKTADWGSTGILADVIAESTSAAGVTIDGLLIKDGAIPSIVVPDGPDVGDVKATVRSTAPTGWLMLNGDTIGNASSGATQDSDDYEDLFELFWDSMTNDEAAVSSGRGASAAADWAANKTLTMPDARGKAIIGTGTGADLTARTHGDTGGAETVTLTTAQMPSHTHGLRIPDASYATNIASTVNRATGTATTTSTTTVTGSNVMAAAGSGDAHANMQPWLALNWIVRY